MAIHKITIQLSDFEMRKLICWAKCHGRPKATYAGQIIGARIEANVDTIQKMMEDIAKHKQVSIEELESIWLTEEGFSLEPSEE